ncbi:MAG: hypothetical protein ACYDB1_11615 [Acidiferrobacteraceae bacterium]
MFPERCPDRGHVPALGGIRVTRRVTGRIVLTYLELVAVLLLIAVLLGVAAERLWRLTSIAEHVAMDNVLGDIRSALGIKVAEYVARDDVQGLKGFAGGNPMQLMAEVPRNYVGVRQGPAGVRGGQWYFNRRDRYLVYVVRSRGEFETPLRSPKRARFVVTLVYGRGGVSGQHRIAGLRLKTVEPYHWRR